MASTFFCIGCGKELKDYGICRTCHDRAERSGGRECPVCGVAGIRHRHGHVRRPFEETQTCGWCGGTVHKAIVKEPRHSRSGDTPFYALLNTEIYGTASVEAEMMAVGGRARA
jgi:DnaJ-class molecular chaperone